MVKKEVSFEKKDMSDNWLSDIDVNSVNKVAELNIREQFKVPLGASKVCTIASHPEKIIFADGNQYFVMKVLENGVNKDFNCTAISIRFALAVLIKKYSEIIGLDVMISKALGNTKERNNVPLYTISKIE